MIDVVNFGSGGAKFNQIAILEMLKDKNVRMLGNIKLVS